jgi:hypothetical protein
MELLLSQLIDHIAEAMPSLATVDEDYGQLEALDKADVNTYPLTFPAVLIDAPDVEWSNLAGDAQKGKARIRVRLIVDCYDDTHYGSSTTDKIKERAELVDTLHYSLQCYRPQGDGPLSRERSAFFTYTHGIKVYEAHYTLTVTDRRQQTTTAAAPRLSLTVSS